MFPERRVFLGEGELGKFNNGEDVCAISLPGALRGVLNPSARRAATLRIGVAEGERTSKKRGLSLAGS